MQQLVARCVVSGCIYFTTASVVMDVYYYLRKRRALTPKEEKE